MDERVQAAGGQLTLFAGARTLDAASAAEISKLVWASPADALFHGEESYYVAFLPDRIWVLPYLTTGIRGLLDAVGPALAGRHALFRAEVSGCPVPWRRRILGLVPLFPTPALGRHPIDTVPEFLGAKPISINELQESEVSNA